MRRKINPGFKNLHVFTTPITIGNPKTSFGRAIQGVIMPQPIPHKSIITWPPEVKLGCPHGGNESTDTHHSKEAAEGVCELARKIGFGGNGEHFPIATRVEPIIEEKK